MIHVSLYSWRHDIGDAFIQTLPNTTYHDLATDYFKKKDYIERPYGVPMVDADSALKLSLERYVHCTVGHTEY